MPATHTVQLWVSNRATAEKALRVCLAQGVIPSQAAHLYFETYPDESRCFVSFQLAGVEAWIRFERP